MKQSRREGESPSLVKPVREALMGRMVNVVFRRCIIGQDKKKKSKKKSC